MTDAAVRVPAIPAERAIALVLAIAAFCVAARFPVVPLAVVGGLSALGFVLLRRPHAWLVVLFGTLPWFDLTPLSGRFFVDELDLMLAVVLAVGLWSGEWRAGAPPAFSSAPWRVLALITVAGAVNGLWSLTTRLATDFAAYFDPWNALRVAKGAAWALALAPLVHASLRRSAVESRRALGAGALVGLALATAAMAWERKAIAGLLDLAVPYRAIGTLSAMHVGGAYVDGTLVTLVALSAGASAAARRTASRLIALPVIVLGCAAAVFTFSRSTFVALAAVLASFAALTAMAHAHTRARRVAYVATAFVVFVLGMATIAAISEGAFVQTRFHRLQRDLDARLAHWHRVVSLLDRDVPRWLVGWGTGTFPALYLDHSGDRRTVSRFRVAGDDSGHWLEFSGGESMYFEQVVSLAATDRYTLSFRARTANDEVELRLYLCEKWLLQSRSCKRFAFPILARDGWTRVSVDFSPYSGWFRSRGLPLKLAIAAPAQGVTIDIDDVALTDPRGTDAIANGGFEAGTDRWFFAVDTYLRWHAQSLPIHVLLEHGLLGFALGAGLAALALARAGRLALEGDPFAAGVFAALLGLLTVGLADSLVDAPRTALLFSLLLLWPFAATAAPAAHLAEPSAASDRINPALGAPDRAAPPAPRRA